MARAYALSVAGAMQFWHGEFEAAEACEHAALALFVDSGDPRRRVFALITLGNCAHAQGDLDRANVLYEQTLELYRAAADERGIAQVGMSMGLVAVYRGDYERAYALLIRSIAAIKAAGDVRSGLYGIRSLAMLHCRQGDFEAAKACAREGLVLWQGVRGRVVLPHLLETAALIAVATGDTVRGLKVAGGAAALRDETDTPRAPIWARELDGWFDRARVAVGPEASSSAWRAGFALDIEGAVAEAFAAVGATGKAVHPASSIKTSAAREALPSGLTQRETEVLRMVAAGNTNKEIARQLVLSVATVERHLANIYGKIGARGRAEATMFAITRGLLPPARD
jgi:ATP/maltotriose-dependent transcriptional regulator MalT